MLFPNPLKCLCGKAPELLYCDVDVRWATETKCIKYSCSSCSISTFGTMKEEVSRELWNAAILFRLKK